MSSFVLNNKLKLKPVINPKEKKGIEVRVNIAPKQVVKPKEVIDVESLSVSDESVGQQDKSIGQQDKSIGQQDKSIGQQDTSIGQTKQSIRQNEEKKTSAPIKIVDKSKTFNFKREDFFNDIRDLDKKMQQLSIVIEENKPSLVDVKPLVDEKVKPLVDDKPSVDDKNDNIPLSKKVRKLKIVSRLTDEKKDEKKEEKKEESTRHESPRHESPQHESPRHESPRHKSPSKEEKESNAISEALSELSPISLSTDIVPQPIHVKKTTIKNKSPEKSSNNLTRKSTDKPKPKLKIVESQEKVVTEKIKKQLMSYDKPVPNIRASNYYLNNRQKFISFINGLFKPYKKEIEENEKETDENQCERGSSNDFSLMAHQKIVRDYMNIYTPYRGLLLYHGLGSGKTCTSIGIAEGLKTTRNVIILTPASLQTNFREELKKCGDYLYKKNKHWEFISTDKKPSLVKLFENELSLSAQFISSQKGVWLVNNEKGKEPNYSELSPEDKKKLDNQIEKMIDAKYSFIAYNGIRWKGLKKYTNDYSENPFDNKVVIIDEAHNFVSRIVNKIDKNSNSISNDSNVIASLLNRIDDVQEEYSQCMKDKKKIIVNIEQAEVNLKLIKQGTMEDSEKKLKIVELTKEIFKLKESLLEKKSQCLKLLNEKKTTQNSLGSLSCRLYEYLMSAKNAKIILLSGTPMINYPNEIGILFNILRGKITTWNLTLSFENMQKKGPINNAYFDSILKASGNIHDYYDFNVKTNTLSITRNPFGFVSSTEEKYDGVHVSDEGAILDNVFIEKLTDIFKRNGISVLSISENTYKALPDKRDEFKSYFFPKDKNGNDAKELQNPNLLKRRIIGLTSYFRSAQESLMPSYGENNFHIVYSDMSDHQFGLYNEARIEERKKETQNQLLKKRGVTDDELSSTYRIFSRAFCNFVFPQGINRPFPNSTDTLATAVARDSNEDMLDAVTEKEKMLNVDGLYEADDIDIEEEEQDDDEEKSEYERQLEKEAEAKQPPSEKDKEKGTKIVRKNYDARIKQAIIKLINNKKYLSKEGLKTISPKFLKMLENIQENMGSLHLIYSQFRTLEGIGIIRYILEANGFVRFKIKKDKNDKNWTLDMDKYRDKDGKLVLPPTFILYTGTESADEKEVLRNIFNGDWKYIPQSIRDELSQIAPNNMYGEIIKIIMITASGAEGISLKNVRNVHITEPYWHPVRMDQVIGRARRICSHQDLPKELRTVDVYLYLMKLSDKQLSKEMMPIDMSQKDRSKDGKSIFTSDQTLHEISVIKKNLTQSILNAVKESAIDCAIHNKGTENLQCYTFISENSKNMSYVPDINKEQKDSEAEQNVKIVERKIFRVDLPNGEYHYVDEEKNVYDKSLYEKNKTLSKIGELIRNSNGKYLIK